MFLLAKAGLCHVTLMAPSTWTVLCHVTVGSLGANVFVCIVIGLRVVRWYKAAVRAGS